MTTATKARVRRGTSAARVRLEEVLLGLRELPAGIDRAPLAAAIERALAGVLAMADMDVDHDRFFPAIDAVLGAASEAVGALRPLGEGSAVIRGLDDLALVDRGLRALRDAAIDALVTMKDARLRGAPAPAAEAPLAPFRASTGWPALHDVRRSPARVLIDLRSDAPQDDDAEDVVDEPPEAPWPAASTPADALLLEHARTTARDCLADLAALSGLRAPLPEAPWTNAAPFERRLLANLDALLALAAEPTGFPDAWDLHLEIQRWAREAPVVDPWREQARAFAFACTAGEPSLRAIVLTLKQAHADTLDAYRDALALSRHPATADVMRELLLVDPDPRRAALALEVLRFCRQIRFADVVVPSAHPDERTRAAAYRALAVVPERGAAAELLVDALADEEEPVAALAAAESLLRLGHVEGLTWVRRRIDEGEVDKVPELRLDHLRLLAVAGGRRDLDRFMRISEVAPGDALLAGLFGHTALVPHLLDTLGAANRIGRSIGPWAHPVEIAAAEALERITGAGLHDTVRGVDDYDFESRPALFAEAWAAWWEPRAAELLAQGKLRWGKPWVPAATVSELGAPGPTAIRADLALELSVVTPDVGFEPGDWVARQEGALAEAAARASSSPHPAGTFPEAWLTRG